MNKVVLLSENKSLRGRKPFICFPYSYTFLFNFTLLIFYIYQIIFNLKPGFQALSKSFKPVMLRLIHKLCLKLQNIPITFKYSRSLF